MRQRRLTEYLPAEEHEGVEVRRIEVRTILSRSSLYGVEYSLNPYIGCSHACAYCFARYTFERRGIDPTLWGKLVLVKSNAVDVLRREVRRVARGKVLVSSVCDAWQHVERRVLLTRRLIEVLVAHGFPLVILTKSPLVLRDLDLIARVECEAGMTITTLDEDVRREFEPRAPRICDRLNALRALASRVGRTYMMIAPMLPVFIERELENLLEEALSVGVERVMVDRLNLRARNWVVVDRVLRESFPSVRDEFWRRAKSEEYWQSLKKVVAKTAERLRIRVDFCY